MFKYALSNKKNKWIVHNSALTPKNVIILSGIYYERKEDKETEITWTIPASL